MPGIRSKNGLCFSYPLQRAEVSAEVRRPEVGRRVGGDVAYAQVLTSDAVPRA